MVEKNFVVYLGDFHQELENFKIFSYLKKVGGNGQIDLLELNAVDVLIEPSFLKFLSHPLSKDDNHPAYKLRKPIFDKSKIFRLNDSNPATIIVLPTEFENLAKCFRDDPVWGTCFEYGYKMKNEILKDAWAMRNEGRKENEILNHLTESVTKLDEEFHHRIKGVIDIMATSTPKPQIPQQQTPQFGNSANNY